jgi:hypothetical protein
VHTFSYIQDYTWENHGFSLVNRLYSDIGHLLDEKFRMVYNLTYNTMATHEDVDTTTLRRALFNYVHCMFGIRYVHCADNFIQLSGYSDICLIYSLFGATPFRGKCYLVYLRDFFFNLKCYKSGA